jgi:2-dehydro-3-deoxygluconokinase
VTFGETMLRFSPPGDTPLERAETLDVYAAGAESNVAAAAAQLGCDAVWTSKLPDSSPGRRVTAELRSFGVEPRVVWSEEGRQGTYYVERADQPRGTDVTYDRAHATVTTATPGELPTAAIEAADALHTTGITPALSATLEETTERLLATAREADTTTVFDLNYRSKLWSPGEARAVCTDLLAHVDVLVVAERDAETVLDIDEPASEQAERLATEHDIETVVVTRGGEGALARHEKMIHEQPVFETTDAHPVGTGDAFVGGFLARRLQGGSVPEALSWGAATAALKRTMPGDMVTITPADVERVVAGDHADISR